MMLSPGMVIDLQSVTLREIRLTLKEPFVTAGGVQEHRRILLLELRARDGHTAWSECVAQERPGYSLETIDTAWTVLREDLAPLLLGAAARGQHVPAVFGAHAGSHRMAIASLEMACWTLEAERQNTSLASLLGGTQVRVPVGVALGMQPNPSTLIEKVRRCVGEGYRKIKLKVAPGADRRFVAAVREAVGPDVPLAIDANGTYSREHLDTLRSLDAFGLLMLEQPLRREDMAGHAALQRQLKTPICLDESITTRRDIEAMIRWGSGRIVNVKPGRVGGLTRAVEMHDLCRENGPAAWVGGMLESGIGRAYNVALASLPNFSLPSDLSPSTRYWERDIVEPEWTMSSDGFVDVPFDRPGLGVEIDRDRIENLTCRTDHIAF